MMTQSVNPTKAPINWPATLVLTLTPLLALILIPWYSWNYDFSTAAWVSFFIIFPLNGLSITAGYHRLWAHRAYEASWPVRFVLMIFGTMAVQNSILFWSAGHRNHHRFVDDVDLDPYSAKRGFWFSHMGWMLRDYPSGHLDYKNVPDLKKDKMVMFQHKHYTLLAVLTNFGIPLAIGYMSGDVWGVFLLAGLLRLVISHHFTFFINSWAHISGSQPYTDQNTARDNPVMALFTWGEGYHNFHHIFQYDYRNGVKWWHYDPTKWLIYGMSKLGLARKLRRIPRFIIEKAEVEMKFKHAEKTLNVYGMEFKDDLNALREKISAEYEAYKKTVNDWSKLKEQEINATKEQINQTFRQADHKLKHEFHKMEHTMHAHLQRTQALLDAMNKKLGAVQS
ncbi:MAG: fatty acid desaturase [Hydromonas sp.]|jgi:stearoyl-CoA desaturase (delta-9 desaturase)|nr:fatty acid desaturase [Hydromonas sp.]MBP6294093.1 fatty acid desaturase [Hydromonas sp.]